MAAWQFDLIVAPRINVAKFMVGESTIADRTIIQDQDLWEGVSLPNDFESNVGHILPATASWSKNWRVFGTDDGNRVDVIENEGRIEELRFRFDARALSVDLIEALLRTLDDCDCVLIAPNGHVFVPTLDSVWIELQLSNASYFVSNPQSFLDHLGQSDRLE